MDMAVAYSTLGDEVSNHLYYTSYSYLHSYERTCHVPVLPPLGLPPTLWHGG